MTSSSRIIINCHDITCSLKNRIYLSFINEPPKIEATALSLIHFLGLLDSRACRLSLRFINRSGGHFLFSPSCLFASSSSSALASRAQPPPSSLRLWPQLRPLHHPDYTRESRRHSAIPSASVSLLSFHPRSATRVSVFNGVLRCSSVFIAAQYILTQTLTFIRIAISIVLLSISASHLSRKSPLYPSTVQVPEYLTLNIFPLSDVR